MASTDKLEQYKVHKVQELKRQNRREEAREILERVSKQVQPILRKRQWTVPLLREFLPRNPNLLGLNKNGGRGKTMEINVRLRYHHSPDCFYPYEDILGTMLHEITHNVRGPHDNQFYSILEELTKECEELMQKGITGTGVGFDGPSMGRLGAHSWIPTHNPPSEAMRDMQIKAAKRRAAQQAVMSSGPQKVGGSLAVGSLRHLPPSQAAAEAAARRQRDDRQCPSAALAAGEICTIDLLDEDSDDEGGPHAGNKGAAGIHHGDKAYGTRLYKAQPPAAAAMVGREAVKHAAGPCAQLGIFAGKPVPGFPALGGCERSNPSQVSEGAIRNNDKLMSNTVGDSKSHGGTVGTSSGVRTTIGKAANDSAAAEVVDLSSPVACCRRQAVMSQQKKGSSYKSYGQCDVVDASEIPIPSKRTREALSPCKGPVDSYIDLT